MIITVFGANGKVGRIVVAKLLEEGHSVKAFVHGHNLFDSNPRLGVVIGDVGNKNAVFDIVAGSEVVISTLGSWGTKNKNILSLGMSNIIPAAEKSGTSQIISLTGAQAVAPDEKMKLQDQLLRILLKTFAKKILEDGENHIALLQKSSLSWTVIRSPIMNDRFSPNHYVLSANPPKFWQTIARVDVASALVDLLKENSWVNRAPFIRRK